MGRKSPHHPSLLAVLSLLLCFGCCKAAHPETSVSIGTFGRFGGECADANRTGPWGSLHCSPVLALTHHGHGGGLLWIMFGGDLADPTKKKKEKERYT